MPRKPRPLDRDTGVVRDATLVVIASEDTYAVNNYFARFSPRRVQFRVLPTEDGRSAPQHIQERLDAFCKEFDIGENDQFWYCGDTDHWATGGHLQNLLQVLQYCSQKGYHVALSKPCFELWLLLHFSALPSNIATCQEVCDELSKAAGGYSKEGGLTTQFTAEMVAEAVRRAVQLDKGTQKIPNTPITRIYRILNVLIARESIVVGDKPPIPDG